MVWRRVLLPDALANAGRKKPLVVKEPKEVLAGRIFFWRDPGSFGQQSRSHEAGVPVLTLAPQRQPSAEPTRAGNQDEVCCPLGKEGDRRWVYAERMLAECFAGGSAQCPNALQVGGGFCCRALLNSVPLAERQTRAPEVAITDHRPGQSGERFRSRRRGRLGRVKYRFRRIRNRITDIVFFLVIIPAFIATILFAVESCQRSSAVRGALPGSAQPETSR